MSYIKTNEDNIESPIFQQVNSMDVFNLLQDIGTSKLIIDLRNKEQYQQNHIKTAVNLSPPEQKTITTSEGGDTIEEFSLRKYITSNSTVKNWNLIFKKVIIYSDKPFKYDDDDDNNNFIVDGADTIGDNIQDWEQTVLKYLLSNKRKTKVLIYKDNFNLFQQLYPFVCNGSNNKPSSVKVYPSEIIENFMYLGGQENASSRQQIQNLKITHIINMAGELEDEYPHIYKYYRADLEDSPHANINFHLEPCIEFINQAKKQGGRVLVHCAMGISRSSSIVIAYLIKENNMTFTDALLYCKSKRSITNPNFGFVKQLKDYQENLEKLK